MSKSILIYIILLIIHVCSVQAKLPGLQISNNMRYGNGKEEYANLKKDQEEIIDPPLGGKAIMDQYDRLFNTMIEWSDELIEEYQNNYSNDT